VLKQQLDVARDSEERLVAELRTLRGAPPQRQSSDTAAPLDVPGVPPVQPQGLYAARPDKVDDLQKIRGIGEGFERGLNRLGIYRYSQLAGLSAGEIVWLENNLPTFRGRVERDDWPAQAVALLAAEPGSDWARRSGEPLPARPN